MNDPVTISRPTCGAEEIPLVFDSPHSGYDYPDDMNSIVPVEILRQTEDAFIDALFGHVSVLGAVFLKAMFPRCYIDPNRSTEDIEVAALDGPWPGPVNNSIKVNRGAGLTFTKIQGEREIYDRKLTVAEVQHRIDAYWQPYHAALNGELDRLYETYYQVWHINCHSMPAKGNEHYEDGPVERADFVLGDRDGTTCAPELTQFVAEFLSGRGYDVGINWPMKGVELVRKHGRPDENRHSLQIEVNRRLYMHEEEITQNDLYPATALVLAEMNAQIANFVRGRLD
jgi:N-formylglutamate deformylase